MSPSSGAASAAGGAVVKHSLTIAGHRTSISLERAFWERLKMIAAERGASLASCVAEIDAGRGGANLSSAIRVFVLEAALGGKHDAEKSQTFRLRSCVSTKA